MIAVKVICTLAAVGLAVSSFVSCTGLSELEPQSGPVTDDNVVGVYIPSHSGVETLQVRSDYVWVRTYYYPAGEVAVDSGSWKLFPWPDSTYLFEIDNFGDRFPGWASHESLSESWRTYDGSPTKPTKNHFDIRNDKGRIWFRLSMNYPELYYEKK